MEIYRDTAGTITFEHPYAGVTHVDVYDNVALALSPLAPILATITLTTGLTFASGVYTLVLPYTLTQFDRVLRLRWRDDIVAPNTFSRDSSVSVVSPIVSTRLISALPSYAGTSWAKADLVSVETKVRHAIRAYTGQEFGYFEGTINIFGTGNPYLKLPRRLVELVGITGAPAPALYQITGDGWYITVPDYTILDLKQDPPEQFQTFNQVSGYGIVVVTPSWYSTFGNHIPFGVTGKWGYLEIPQAVREAALLLAEDYANMDITYRDRYMVNVGATDWTLGYSPLAYAGTGNSRADALLEDYKSNRMEII